MAGLTHEGLQPADSHGGLPGAERGSISDEATIINEAVEVQWLQEHSLGEVIDDAVRRLLAEKPANPRQALSRYILEDDPQQPTEPQQPAASVGPVRNAGLHQIEASALMTEYCDLMPLKYTEGDPDSAVVGGGRRGFTFADIGPQDCLLVIDMQNDFVPRGLFNERGGRLACPEGDTISNAIVQLMGHFASLGGHVVATKDYHPWNHCSFAGHGGHLPVHCVGGHAGANFYEPIGRKLQGLLSEARTKEQVTIAFKGYHASVDSFGGFTYTAEDAKARDRIEGLAKLPVNQGEVHPEALTGCRLFQCSARELDGDVDPDAPPDAIGGEHARKLEDALRALTLKRLFVCGLALDFCVLDTSCNGRKLGFEEVYLITDASRPAYIPASDFHKPPFGSGFLQDPAAIRSKAQSYGVQFCFVRHLLPRAFKPPQQRATLSVDGTMSFTDGPVSSNLVGQGFPNHLGPWRLHLAPMALKKLEVTRQPDDRSNGSFRVHLDSTLHALGVARDGVLGPISEVNFPPELRMRLNIPSGDVHYCFAHALKGAGMLARDPRYSWCLHDPTYTFLMLGGFVYFSQRTKPVAVLAVTGTGEGDSAVSFGAPREETQLPAHIAQRLQPCPEGTLLRTNGVKRIGAVANHELQCEWGGILLERQNAFLIFPFNT